MQYDLDHLTPRDPIRSRIVIIGAGIAGLTLAHRLTQQGIAVTLLEAGGPTLEPRSQSLFAEAQLTGAPHGLRDARLRAFGGSSIEWGAQVLPLPSHADWPIPAADLEPYLAPAQHLLGLNDLPFDAQPFNAATHTTTATLPGTNLRFAKFAPFSHRNMAPTVGHDLLHSDKVSLYLHTNVTELLLSPSGDRITAALARNYLGQDFRFEADHFILAAGTLETPRLLLASRSVAEQGIGNTHDQVGRHFHDHLSLVLASPTGAAREHLLRWLAPYIYNGTLHVPKLEATPQLRAELGLNAVLAHLTIDEPEHTGVAVIRDLLHARQQGILAPALRKSLPDLPGAVLEAAHLGWNATIHHRRFVSSRAAISLRLNVAQQAPADSRITLTNDLDAIGMPIIAVDYKISASEINTLRRFATHLRKTLPALDNLNWNLTLFTPDADLALEDVCHQMGGALMGTDPRTSVVDPNLTVHGIPNLHLASAATFPPNGSPLPTLTLMALSLRLADRLATFA